MIKKTSAARVQWETLDTQNKFTGSGIKNENILNIKLAEELLEISRKEKYFHLLDNIWGTELFVTQLRNKFNTGFRFLLCVTDIFNKYG